MAVGRAAVGAGLLLLAFAGYQLWGTGHSEAHAQRSLAAELEARHGPRSRPGGPIDLHEPADAAIVGPIEQGQEVGLGATPAPPADPVGDTTPVVAPAARAVPAPVAVGDPLVRLRIPAIGVDKTVVEGTSREALRSGPGHYLGTALPGRAGNVAIAGHRTTYGAPFRDIDQLVPGDEIVLESADGVFTYRVEAADDHGTGHRIVAPEDVEVIADQGDHRLTLTACHPLYSARQRIVVTAVLDGPPLAEPPPVAEAMAEVTLPESPSAWGGRPPTERPPGPSGTLRPAPVPEPASSLDQRALAAGPAVGLAGSDDGLGWQWQHLRITTAWAGLTVLIAGGAVALGRLWRRWPAYLVAAPSFSLALLTCFGHLDRLLPAV